MMEKDPRAKSQQEIRQERRVAEIRKTISDWRSSGLSAKEFGDSIGMPKATIHSWSREVRQRDPGSANINVDGSHEMPLVKKEHPKFLPLIAAAPQSEVNVQGSLCLEMFLREGRRVAVSGLQLHQVAPLIMALDGVRG